MHPIFHLFPLTDSLYSRGAGKKGSCINFLISHHFLRVPACVFPIAMRVVKPELFVLAEATPGWHMLVASWLHQRIALLYSPKMVERRFQGFCENHETGLVLGIPAAQEVTHG